MDYINELVYANHIAQTKQLAKDKKQKNKYRQIALLDDNENTDKVSEKRLKTIREEDDRRNGKDRRKEQQVRGRYVESRQKKNRRHKPELSLMI
jgi:hypothetical protein